MPELDERGAAPMAADIGGMVDVKELDAEQAARRQPHPFQEYCERVMRECEVPTNQGARQITSDVCQAVARLPVIVETAAERKEQAKLIADAAVRDRKEAGDTMLWDGVALKLATHALDLRVKGEAPVAETVEAA